MAAVLFSFAVFVSQAKAQSFSEEGKDYLAVADGVDADVAKLNPDESAIVGVVKNALGRADEMELRYLIVRLKSNYPEWQITNVSQRAFWIEVVNIAIIHAHWRNSCSDRDDVLALYVVEYLEKKDEVCLRLSEAVKSIGSVQPKQPLATSQHEDCTKSDPVAIARFDRALTYFYVRHYGHYKCERVQE
ncbi:hypothetical protein HY771_01300 [Candidatus Uhrbacteria bacterium]|nr:hypothetical protein [Candidatus Uhrbacteria bacterium]